MKLKGKPLLFRTIIGEVKHKKKLYEVTIREDLTENDFEIKTFFHFNFRFLFEAPFLGLFQEWLLHN